MQVRRRVTVLVTGQRRAEDEHAHCAVRLARRTRRRSEIRLHSSRAQAYRRSGFFRQVLVMQRLSTLLYVDCALMRERFEPKYAVIAAHAALIDTAERQLVFQVMGEKSVDRHSAR